MIPALEGSTSVAMDGVDLALRRRARDDHVRGDAVETRRQRHRLAVVPGAVRDHALRDSNSARAQHISATGVGLG